MRGERARAGPEPGRQPPGCRGRCTLDKLHTSQRRSSPRRLLATGPVANPHVRTGRPARREPTSRRRNRRRERRPSTRSAGVAERGRTLTVRGAGRTAAPCWKPQGTLVGNGWLAPDGILDSLGYLVESALELLGIASTTKSVLAGGSANCLLCPTASLLRPVFDAPCNASDPAADGHGVPPVSVRALQKRRRISPTRIEHVGLRRRLPAFAFRHVDAVELPRRPRRR